jgi:hypothetical protein
MLHVFAEMIKAPSPAQTQYSKLVGKKLIMHKKMDDIHNTTTKSIVFSFLFSSFLIHCSLN